MSLIKKRRLERLALISAQNQAAKTASKSGKGEAPVLSKMQQKLMDKKAKKAKAEAKAEAGKAKAEEKPEGEKLDDLEHQVDGVEGSVDELKTNVGDLENRVDDVEYDVQQIKEKLQDDSEYIGNPELETHKAILVSSIDEMREVNDIEDRKAYKAEAIVKLEAFVNGYVKSAANYPNIVAVWVMIWLFDLGDIARAMPLALHLAKQKIHNMPTRFKSEIETFICDQMYDWANAKLEANKSAGPYLEQLINTIESDKWQLPDIVHGKMYAIYGKHLDALGEDEAALKAYETAMEINPRAGVKKRIEQLTATLAKTKES